MIEQSSHGLALQSRDGMGEEDCTNTFDGLHGLAFEDGNPEYQSHSLNDGKMHTHAEYVFRGRTNGDKAQVITHQYTAPLYPTASFP